MATLTNAGVFYESGQSQQAFAAMTDAGAHTAYSITAKPWSQVAGYEYTVRPYGLATGGAVTPNDWINTAVKPAVITGGKK